MNSLQALNLHADKITSRRFNSNADSSDNIYYNVNIENATETAGTSLIFSENRTTPVLDNPSDYEMAIVRALIPSVNIPLMFFPDNLYVKLQYGNDFVQEPLVYIPNGLTPNPFAPLGKLPIYDYSELTESLNIALSDAKAALDILVPAVAGFDDPFVSYDASTQLFALNGEIAGYDDGLGAGSYIEIIFSAKLFNYYNNLQDFFLNPNETRLRVYDTFTNTITFNAKPYFTMIQSQSSLELFAEIQKIVIFSNSIPVVQELQGTQNDNQRRVLFDFNVTGVADKNLITFFPQGPLRWYSLVSSYPLKQIDCEIVWEDHAGETYPIFINTDTSASLKIHFRKKINLRLEGE